MGAAHSLLQQIDSLLLTAVIVMILASPRPRFVSRRRTRMPAPDPASKFPRGLLGWVDGWLEGCGWVHEGLVVGSWRQGEPVYPCLHNRGLGSSAAIEGPWNSRTEILPRRAGDGGGKT